MGRDSLLVWFDRQTGRRARQAGTGGGVCEPWLACSKGVLHNGSNSNLGTNGTERYWGGGTRMQSVSQSV